MSAFKEELSVPKKNTKRQASVLPLAFIVSGLILLVAAIYFALNQSSVTPAPTTEASGIPYPNVPRISLADAKAAYDLSSATFVDVRGEPYYSQGHIQGALLITEAELDTALAQIDPQTWIITYCT